MTTLTIEIVFHAPVDDPVKKGEKIDNAFEIYSVP